MEPPKFPVGPAPAEAPLTQASREEWTRDLEEAPSLLRKTTEGLTGDRLDTLYKNWTLRQIVHHLADSHVNSYVRFKWTLTEDQPLIKAYDEDKWNALPDAKNGGIGSALHMMEGIHDRWVQLLRSMALEDFNRSFRHPDGRTIPLSRALAIYAWHGKHHRGQIQWVKAQKGWE